MCTTLDRVPAHLRTYVVEQNYNAYDEIDQCVWRFTMLQAFNQLKETAHHIYCEGLQRTGLTVDSIPRIQDMDQRLMEFGWGAVAVNGFISPRAFQEFQALGILALNAPIRSWDHLAYTPAPDIIHEAAGHAPIIPNEAYRNFLQRFGRLGRMAFSCKEDIGVYEAIRALSDLKEDITSSSEALKRAEERVLASMDDLQFTSESSFLTRLHWWTVEYGLIGSPKHYKSYGAGILSSISECIMLRLPEVKKLRLRARCVETDYNITEQQPQLFVVENFEALDDILDQVTADFSFHVGGKLAMQRFAASGEVGTLHFNSGLQITGKLEEVIGQVPAYLRFVGPCALSYNNKTLRGHGQEHHEEDYGTPIGRLQDGTALSSLSEYDLGRFKYKGPGSQICFNYQSGVTVEGQLDRIVTGLDGNLMLLSFSCCRVTLGDRLLFDPSWGSYDLGVGEAVPTAYAGAADPSYWPETQFSENKYPRPKCYRGKDLQLLGLFQKVMIAKQGTIEDALPIYESTCSTLLQCFPDQWLLAWNILEELTNADRGLKLAARLKSFMLEIESLRPKEIPVAMGLKYLGLQ